MPTLLPPAPPAFAANADDVAERMRAEETRVSEDPVSDEQLDELAHSMAWVFGEIADDHELSERVAAAATTVEFRFVDAREPRSVSVCLDRVPVEFIDGPLDDPGVRIFITARDMARYLMGEAHLATMIIRGRVGYEGPVRQLLRVMPIVQRLLPEYAKQHGSIVIAEGRTDGSAPADAPNGQELLHGTAERHDDDLHEGALDYEERTPGEFWSISCENVRKSFGPNHVLRGLDLKIPEGLITVILGPSGTGKSVLINHLIGLMWPDEGEVLVHGEKLRKMTRTQLLNMRKRFGILFQDGALFGSMNLYDNVAFPLRELTDTGEEEIEHKVESLLADVGLTAATHRMPNELSGGMRKRAGFARALILEPDIVLFDEPDSGLDPVRTALLCTLIKQVHQRHGGTYVLITHDIASARQVGDYVAVLWKGKIVQAGEADLMFNSGNPFVRQFLNRSEDGPLSME